MLELLTWESPACPPPACQALCTQHVHSTSCSAFQPWLESCRPEGGRPSGKAMGSSGRQKPQRSAAPSHPVLHRSTTRALSQHSHRKREDVWKDSREKTKLGTQGL